eukprot:TRINITY_DN4306_c0_g1_i1.p1 TRINITY_DN4306_c0_g1~~TRINITY_DN4306_c0_g1_i1.p1  ORF type:complete len:179 (-),score=30.68 TRINITY_DN4306_c0_g1_i1:133-669(-)
MEESRRPFTFSTLFGPRLISSTGDEISTDETLNGKFVGIYFSAHWCPPCRAFTPQLAQFFQKNRKALDLEIVFVSSDRDERAWSEYFGTMPWTAIPFNERSIKQSLSSKFSVMGIPTLVILDSHGEIMTNNGRGMVLQDQSGRDFPWKGTSTAATENPMFRLVFFALVIYFAVRYFSS